MTFLINRLQTVVNIFFENHSYKDFKKYQNDSQYLSDIYSLQIQKRNLLVKIKEKLVDEGEKVERIKRVQNSLKFFKTSKQRQKNLTRRENLKNSYLPPINFHNSNHLRKINFLLEFSKNILKKENLKPILSYVAHNLKCSGTLKQRGDRVFLEVDKNFVFGIKKLLNEKFSQLPSDFGLNIGEIEVINKNEFFLNDLDNIKETFQNIKFFIKAFYSIKPSNEKNIEKIYFLEIECDEIENIRRKYGLAPKPFGRNFHLPIAFIKIKNKKTLANTFKINIAYIAA